METKSDKWRDQTTPAIVCGRMFCSYKGHAGRRWLPICYFGIMQRRPAGQPLKLQRYCISCARLENRLYHQRKRKIITKRVLRQRKRKNNPYLPVGPFQDWLAYQVQVNSIGGVARNIGVSSRRISAFLLGYYYKNNVRYEVRAVRLATVDKWMTSFGEQFSSIYSEEIICAGQKKRKFSPKRNDLSTKEKQGYQA